MDERRTEERRKINRVLFPSNSVIVVCDTQEKIFCHTENMSPLGMGIRLQADAPMIEGMDVIVVGETIIMYADVTRQVKQDDGTYIIGVQARKFTPEVLQYLFDRI